jgi:hypothetical protein
LKQGGRRDFYPLRVTDIGHEPLACATGFITFGSGGGASPGDDFTRIAAIIQKNFCRPQPLGASPSLKENPALVQRIPAHGVGSPLTLLLRNLI